MIDINSFIEKNVTFRNESMFQKNIMLIMIDFVTKLKDVVSW